jgi:ubiquinone/menaquinone biosynthesis C-methylase UbiE
MSKSLVQKHFGAAASAYVTSPVHAKGASLGRLVDLAEPASDWRMLDIATAAGHTALAFAPHVANVIATDLTREMLTEATKLAAERGVGNVEFREADAEALPFPDGSFDLVTCRIAAHHFPNVPAFVAEVARVLKPGGTLGLVDNVSPDAETTPGFPPEELAQAAETYNTFEKLRDPSHGRCLTSGEWIEMLGRYRFAVAHAEHLPKEMDFAPWVKRMGVDDATVARLETMLTGAQPALRAFLKPRRENGKLAFTLDELLAIARKPQAKEHA